MGCKQDVALQRARSTIMQRNHLFLWMAPFRYRGRSVRIGQVRRDVGVKATTKSAALTTHVIDANVAEACEYFLHSLIVAGAVEQFGLVEGMAPVISLAAGQGSGLGCS
ncbi:MAG: LssY C-terminal domain-containing protein [Lysobacterales bacterium]